MSKITIANLSPAGSDLFLDSDSFLTDLTDTELEGTNGGGTHVVAAVAAGATVAAVAGAAVALAGVGVGVAISVNLK